jgi:hypothetical protein
MGGCMIQTEEPMGMVGMVSAAAVDCIDFSLLAL